MAGLTYALYYIFGKKMLQRYATSTLFLYALPVGALGLLPFVELSSMNPTAWAALFVLAFVSTWCAYNLYYRGLKHVEASRAAVVATLEPVVAAVMAYFWWDEKFTLFGICGAALILIAVINLVFERKKSSAPASPAA